MQIPLIAQDKANHFAYGATVCSITDAAALAVVALAGYCGLAVPFGAVLPIAAGVLATVAIAAVKEWVYDARRQDAHTVDPQDFLATVSGMLPVTAPLLLLHLVRA